MNSHGRWPNPDPAGLAAATPGDPQTLNRYVYVRNSPLTLTDPSGLREECRDGCSWLRPKGPAMCQDICSGFSWYPDSDTFFAEMETAASGYEIFDAIEGAPGTYISYNMYGQMSFGFSVDLYEVTLNTIDRIRHAMEDPNSPNLLGEHDITNPGPYPWTGFVVTARDLGADTIVSGVVPDYLQTSGQLSILGQQSKAIRDDVAAYYAACGYICPLPPYLQRQADAMENRFDAAVEQFNTAYERLISTILGTP